MLIINESGKKVLGEVYFLEFSLQYLNNSLRHSAGFLKYLMELEQAGNTGLALVKNTYAQMVNYNVYVTV